jgi:hypothetical protein
MNRATRYIWGDADDTVGRKAAEGTTDPVSAPYGFEVSAGVGRDTADQMPEGVAVMMADQLRQHSA